MTLRYIAIVIAAVLALPGIVMILRDAHAAYSDGKGAADRGWHVLWTAIPVALLVVLVAFAVVA